MLLLASCGCQPIDGQNNMPDDEGGAAGAQASVGGSAANGGQSAHYGGDGSAPGGSGGATNYPLCPTSGPAPDDIIVEKTMPPGEHYNIASFRLWYPRGLERARGIVVLVSGSNQDGRGLAEDWSWQQFAKRNGLALLGCYFTDYQPLLDEEYAQAVLGSGQAMLDAITAISQETERCEIADAPLLMWGFSAGGQYDYAFACFAPERVIGFVVNKGGFYHPVPAPSETWRVPSLMFIGADDLQRRIDAINAAYSSGRSQGAPWALAVEPDVAHDWGGSVALSRLFFEGILPLRLPPEGGQALQDVDQSEGYIGDLSTLTISPAGSTPPANLAQTAWLPTESVAQAWRDLVAP
jgi:hypothetical protein